MNPRAIDTVQMIHDSLPTVAATAPIENRINGGTPLATQNAPVQSIPRWSPSALAALSPTATFTARALKSTAPIDSALEPFGLADALPDGAFHRGAHARPLFMRCAKRIRNNG